MVLSVVIVNYNVSKFLKNCLNSVYKAVKNMDAEIIVIDNNSTDDSIEMLQQYFKNIILIKNTENTGYSKANNQGIKIAKGEHILLLNPDTLVTKTTFDECLTFYKSQPKIGALGVHMVNGKGAYLHESKRAIPTAKVTFYKVLGLANLFPNSKRFSKYHLGYLSKNGIHKIEVLSGAFFFTKKSILEQVGLLDEDFFMYGEDIDLSYRIELAGYQNYYLGSTKIIHFKGQSTDKKSDKYVQLFHIAMIKFVDKHLASKQSKLINKLIYSAIYFRAFLSSIKRLF